VGLHPTAPTSGSLIDLEEMSLTGKLAFLKQNPKWKCMNKKEVLGEHSENWRSNGMSDLKYTELARVQKGTGCIQVQVDICLNQHWTDQVCGLDDAQFDVPIEELKKRFSSSSSSTSTSSSSSGGGREK